MVDVALGRVDREIVDALGLFGRTEGEEREHLRLATGEETGSVRAGSKTRLHPDRADLLGRAAVGAVLIHRDAVADGPLDDRLERLRERGLVLRRGLVAQHGGSGGTLGV